jgi:hypothetical protein
MPLKGAQTLRLIFRNFKLAVLSSTGSSFRRDRTIDSKLPKDSSSNASTARLNSIKEGRTTEGDRGSAVKKYKTSGDALAYEENLKLRQRREVREGKEFRMAWRNFKSRFAWRYNLVRE